MSLSRIGQVRKISPDGTQSTLAILCPSSTTRTAGLALDERSNVYVVLNPCGTTGDRAIWQVTPQGQQWLVANLPSTARLNGIAYHEGWLYVADSRLGQVWRVHSDGQSPAKVWSADPSLQHPPNPEPGIPGPNGLQVFDDEVYVSVSTRDHVVALPINEDGSAGPGRVHVEVRSRRFCLRQERKPVRHDQFRSTGGAHHSGRHDRTLADCSRWAGRTNFRSLRSQESQKGSLYREWSPSTVPGPEPSSAQHHAAPYRDQRRAAAVRATPMPSFGGSVGYVRMGIRKHFFAPAPTGASHGTPHSSTEGLDASPPLGWPPLINVAGIELKENMHCETRSRSSIPYLAPWPFNKSLSTQSG